MNNYRQIGKRSQYVPYGSSHSGTLSLAIPPWLGTVSTIESCGI